MPPKVTFKFPRQPDPKRLNELYRPAELTAPDITETTKRAFCSKPFPHTNHVKTVVLMQREIPLQR